MHPIIKQNCKVIDKSNVTSLEQQVEQTNNVKPTFKLFEQICDGGKQYFEKIQEAIENYSNTVLTSNFNHFLLQISQSQELFDIFAQTFPFFLNLLIMKDFLQPHKKSHKEASQVDLVHELSKMDTKDVIEVVGQFDKYKLQNNAKLQKFVEVMMQLLQQQPTMFSLPGKGELGFKTQYRECQVSFDLQNTFQYQNKMVEQLTQMLASNDIYAEDQIPIQHFVNNYRDENEQQVSPTQQTIRQLFNRMLPRQNIKIVDDDVKVKLLVAKLMGYEYVNGECIVRPDQLSCIFASNYGVEKFLQVESVTPFYINKYLYYQVKYNVEGYTQLQLVDNPNQNMLEQFTETLDQMKKLYKSTTFRLLTFPTYTSQTIFVKENLKDEDVEAEFLFSPLPCGTCQPNKETMFIWQNMRLEYCFQFMIADIGSQMLLIQEPLFKYGEHFIKLARTMGEDQVQMQYWQKSLNNKDFLNYFMTKIRGAVHLLYYSVVKHNSMTEQIMAIFTIIKSGFLRISHSSFKKYVTLQLSYYEYVHYDRQTTWHTFLQHLQTYFKKPENDSQIIQTHREQDARSFIIQQMPLIDSFMECQPLQLGTDYKSNSSSGIIADITEDCAKLCLQALIHELQHIPRHGYASEIDTATAFLPQILADSTSISPLSSAIRFQYKDQQGVDAGGMWRQTLSIMFNDLLGETKISNDCLFKIKEVGKFGKRELDFAKLNECNPNQPSLLKAVNLPERTILVPHYNGYVCRTSSSVYPRLTDKRSCLYYFGRIVAFCLVYSGKMPNFLHENFWKSLVGGRLYFDEETQKKYAEQYEKDPMFKINGTRPISTMHYPISDEELKTNYKAYIEIWKAALQPNADLDYLGLHEQTLNEIKNMGVDLSLPRMLQKYAARAIQDMRSGYAFAKAYSEFRNGFRHPFATSMTLPNNIPELQELSLMIDKCMDVMPFKDLESILTFDPHLEEYMNRQVAVENLFRRNVTKIQLEIDDTGLQMVLLERIVAQYADKEKFSHKQLLDMVFACSGSRTLTGNEIVVTFIKPHASDMQNNKPIKRYIQFHTCFNQMDVPLLYASQLNDEQLKDYLNECVEQALANGFAMM
uniref:HECT domain-containing protein n=1 Tax=Trepomonas sp. PC1 TaxID=1076344 RepID=A0A146KB16_9EUKA|eukprot:JAP93124.1 hypothetical protein TPC1_14710 [Trepomonas sp. PC1]